jgi:anti-sigma factor RsiW
MHVPWRALAAALVLMVASSGITFVATRDHASAESITRDEVLTSHIRSLMPAHLTDVASNDQHNVKPWFNGRLDFSPSVPRLEDAGFPLLGGRLDYVRGRPVAVVVYGRRQHVINVFTWPADASGDATRTLTTSHGYNLLHWRTGGVEHWVVSDLNAMELQQFAALLDR